jgi:hydrophobic/amphiphilic exporter-1 (mainly G- bacteria), HAE1 family
VTLSELSIRRHVFAFMLSAVLLLFGAIAYQRMGVDKLPYIEFPIISITTNQRGANPDIIDASITNLIETAVNSVPGIEHIQSTSSPGTSQVVITFALEKRIDVAFQEVQAKVNQVVRRLPKDADPPVVAKVETNTQAILQTALQGDRTQQQINLYAINVIKKQLETIDGVGATSASTCCRERWPLSASPRKTSPKPSAASISSSPAASSSAARPSTW